MVFISYISIIRSTICEKLIFYVFIYNVMLTAHKAGPQLRWQCSTRTVYMRTCSRYRLINIPESMFLITLRYLLLQCEVLFALLLTVTLSRLWDEHQTAVTDETGWHYNRHYTWNKLNQFAVEEIILHSVCFTWKTLHLLFTTIVFSEANSAAEMLTPLLETLH